MFCGCLVNLTICNTTYDGHTNHSPRNTRVNCFLLLFQEVKAQRSQERWENVQKRLDTEEAETARKYQQFQDAKLNRIRHFENLEEQGQQRKDMRVGVSDRHLSMFQSTVM